LLKLILCNLPHVRKNSFTIIDELLLIIVALYNCHHLDLYIFGYINKKKKVSIKINLEIKTKFNKKWYLIS
jgi:hypothetical protein